MFDCNHKVIGILGGMGPRATMDLYNHILQLSKVSKEQDHISTLIFSNPKIPDRSMSFVNDTNKKIIYYLQETARVLEKGGADVVVIPCNSAHIYYDNINEAINIPVVNMIEETVNYIFNNLCYKNGIALLSTAATYDSGLYQNFMKPKNIELIQPNQEEKNVIMEAIYSIKLGNNFNSVQHSLSNIVNKWEVPVIMGCTEIPLVLTNIPNKDHLINPTEILAKSAIRFVE